MVPLRPRFRHVGAGNGKSLGALLDTFALPATAASQASGSRPHRALWDTVGAAMLLAALISRGWDREPSIGELLAVAGIPVER